jgi:hypothetical protein
MAQALSPRVSVATMKFWSLVPGLVWPTLPFLLALAVLVLRAVSSLGRLVVSVAGPALYGWYRFDLDLLWGGLFWLALGVRARAAVISSSRLFSCCGCGCELCACCIVVRWAWCGAAWRCGMGIACGAHGHGCAVPLCDARWVRCVCVKGAWVCGAWRMEMWMWVQRMVRGNACGCSTWCVQRVVRRRCM